MISVFQVKDVPAGVLGLAILMIGLAIVGGIAVLVVGLLS